MTETKIVGFRGGSRMLTLDLTSKASSRSFEGQSDMLCLYFKGNFNRYRYIFDVEDPQLNL
ncbi:hypothetical protein TSAR_007933 [Trichomalopsis sarcophagae]|uniref:Uncharacterized protein n=1 Tax=Trichomalopsis sarcophagae TaxID=543379 RepID=A0A232ETC4_9HYME|nr:hypothetical protein TSAR_007933 [Trichomalopsis sarcophagae]